MTVSRRDFIEVSTAAGAGLLIGFRLPARGEVPTVSAEVNAWIQIDPDNSIMITVNESEMGQGILTAVPQIVAEELDADWDLVDARHADADRRFGFQGTFGSSSIRGGFQQLRKVGAAGRQMLLQAAADRWSVTPTSLRTEKSVVYHDASNRRSTYGELATDAAAVPPMDDPPLKDRSAFTIIGKPMKRLDTVAKVKGEATFGIDVQLPGLLVANVAHCPVFGGSLESFDGSKAEAIDGVRHVVELPDGVAVVADNFWAAKKGVEALDIEWNEGEFATMSTDAMRQHCIDIVGSGAEARSEGDVSAALRSGATRVSAVYDAPYLAHATMEPMNCTAYVQGDRCEVWAPTQTPTGAHQAAMRITGFPEDQVVVHNTFLGGGFGRRSLSDYVEDAVHTSKAVGVPVKVIWTREQDMCAGYYRPMVYNEFDAALDAEGWPVAWEHRIAGGSIAGSSGRPMRGIDGTSIEGAANLPYAIPNIRVTWAHAQFPVKSHYWRSVGSSQNAYVTECFLEELAHAGGKDPFEFRRHLLEHHPRHKRVLEVAAARANWGSKLPEGHAHGIAVHEAFGTIVAEVAEVSLEIDGTPRVHHVTCAVDCGDFINPDTVKAQAEGSIVYGLTAALFGQITIENGRAVQRNFDTYPMVRMRDMPTVDVHIVTSGDPMGGMGEPATPPIAPAVCNAIFALTGEPVRSLPILKG